MCERISLDEWPSVICLQKHIARYNFALPYCANVNVADVGSGLGHGSFLLNSVAKSVTGIEVDWESVDRAEKDFSTLISLGELSFVTSSWMDYQYVNYPFDTIVAFEVFEHIGCPMGSIVEHSWYQLNHKGILIASLPVMQGNNKYHLAGDMTYKQCREVFPRAADWDWYEFYYQEIDSEKCSASNVSIYPDERPLEDDGPESGYVIFVGGRK